MIVTITLKVSDEAASKLLEGCDDKSEGTLLDVLLGAMEDKGLNDIKKTYGKIKFDDCWAKGFEEAFIE